MRELGIVIVHFHAEELLARCIECLRASTYTDFRVVVVNNGSDGDDGDLGWIERDKRFELLGSAANVGFAAGTNLGIERLGEDCPLLLSLNPDVLVAPDALAEMISVMKENETLGAATCRLLLPSGGIDPACRRSEPTLGSALAKQLGFSRLAPRSRLLGSYNLNHLDPTTAHAIDAGTGAFLMLRRSALEACGGRLDERFFLYGEDLDLCRRLRAAGWQLIYWPAVSAVHHKGSDRIRAPAVTVHFYRAMWLYYRKWGRYRSNPLLLAPLACALAGLGSLELARNELERRLRRATQ